MNRTLDVVAREASTCTACGLADGRTQVVFGVGDPDADLMFVGEAPGLNEDKQGEPFVGRAGGLLNTLLEGIGLTRDQIYIGNVLKCRPPNNRDPQPEEIESCKPWLKEQITLVDPKLICTLGNFATKLLLGTKTGITKLRGRRFEWRDRILVPTFHPAAVLRGGASQMALIEDDFRVLAKSLEEIRGKASGDAQDDDAQDDDAQEPAEPDPDTEQLGLF